MWFEALLRLKINLDKCELIPIDRVDHVLELGCKGGKLPSTYLGLSLGAPFRSVTVWGGREVLQKTQCEKGNTSLIGGGLC